MRSSPESTVTPSCTLLPWASLSFVSSLPSWPTVSQKPNALWLSISQNMIKCCYQMNLIQNKSDQKNFADPKQLSAQRNCSSLFFCFFFFLFPMSLSHHQNHLCHHYAHCLHCFHCPLLFHCLPGLQFNKASKTNIC